MAILVGNILGTDIGGTSNDSVWSQRFVAVDTGSGIFLKYTARKTGFIKIAIYDDAATQNIIESFDVNSVAGENVVDLTPLAIAVGDYFTVASISDPTALLGYFGGSGTEMRRLSGQTYAGYSFPAAYDWTSGTAFSTLNLNVNISGADVAAYTKKVVFDGDSMSDGLGAQDADYPLQLFDVQSGNWDYTLLGRSGYKADQVLADWASRGGAETLSTEYRNVYSLFIGTNDFVNRTSAQVLSDSLAIMTLSTALYDDSILCTVPINSMLDAAGNIQREIYNTAVRDNATGYGYQVCDFSAMAVFADETDTEIRSDGVHFTAFGSSFAATEFLRALGEIGRIGGCYYVPSRINFNVSNQVLYSFLSSHAPLVSSMVLSASASGSFKRHIYEGTEVDSAALLFSDDAGASVDVGWNETPVTPLQLAENTNYSIGAVPDTTGLYQYFSGPSVARWAQRAATFATFSASNPVGSGLTWTDNGAMFQYYLVGTFPPRIDSATGSDLSTGDVVTVSGRAFLESIGSGKIYLTDNPIFGDSTKQILQTAGEWDNNTASFTVVQGTLVSGNVWIHIVTDLGQTTATGLAKTISGGSPQGIGDMEVAGVEISGAGTSYGTGELEVYGVEISGTGAGLGTGTAEVDGAAISGIGTGYGTGDLEVSGVEIFGLGASEALGIGIMEVAGTEIAGTGTGTGVGVAETSGVEVSGVGAGVGSGTAETSGVEVFGTGTGSGVGDAEVSGVEIFGLGAAGSLGIGNIEVSGAEVSGTGTGAGVGDMETAGAEIEGSGVGSGVGDFEVAGAEVAGTGIGSGVGTAEVDGVEIYGVGAAPDQGIGVMEVDGAAVSGTGAGAGTGDIEVDGAAIYGTGAGLGTGDLETAGVEIYGTGLSDPEGVGELEIYGVEIYGTGVTAGVTTTVYSSAIAMALRLITKKGQAVTWREMFDPVAADPSDPITVTTPTPTDHSTRIVFLPNNSATLRALQYVPNTSIPEGGMIGLMPAGDFEPNLKGVVVRGSEQLFVSKTDPLSPNGEIIMHYVWVKS